MRQQAGRNDPCPCGSGKKYKQCCAGNVLVRQAQLLPERCPDSGLALGAPCFARNYEAALWGMWQEKGLEIQKSEPM